MAGKTISSGRVSVRTSASGLHKLINPEMLRELAALSLILAVAYLVLSIASFDPADSVAATWPHNQTPENLGGHIGAAVIGTLYLYFGVATYFLLSMLGIWAAVIFFRKQLAAWPIKLLGAVLAVCAFAAFFGGSYNGSSAMPTSGGVAGTIIFDLLNSYCGLTGTYLILSFVVAASFLLATDVLFYPLIRDFFRPQASEAGVGDDIDVSFEKTDPDVSFAADGGMAGAKAKGQTGVINKTMNFFLGRSEPKDDTQAIANLSDAVSSAHSTILMSDPNQAGAAVVEAEEEGDDTEDSDDTVIEDKADATVVAVQAAPIVPATPKLNKREQERLRKEKERKLAELRAQFQAQMEAYQAPSAELLDRRRKADSAGARREIENNTTMIISTLKHFQVDVEIVSVERGPTVSLYEFKVPPSLNVKKIETYEKNLSMMLEASQIRILAPIPGRATVGIEVPNRMRDTVSLREVVAHEMFVEAAKGMQLPIALGLDCIGNPLVRDLAKSPHLLIAGTTGSGKSVMQNVILLSLLLTRHYRNVRLILVDPKCVELTPYNDLPFLATPVITDMTKAVAAFEWLVEEMERRYDILAKTRTKKITEYNALPVEERCKRLEERDGNPADGQEALPYIVVMVDELADMMMATNDTRVDELICRIAQKARAAGIHLILATQRPSADVVTGLIKANVPARIGFKLPGQIDSRTILNATGAEKLLGLGDMLLDWNDGKGLMRAQSGFCDNPEIERICEEIRKQGKPNYLIKPKKLKRADPNDNMIGGQPRHEKLDEAIKCILEDGRPSAQFLRSKLRVGYNAATTIIMQMEALGILGPARGSKEREVLMTFEQWQMLNVEHDDEDDE